MSLNDYLNYEIKVNRISVDIDWANIANNWILEVYLMGIYGLSPSPGYKSRGDGQTTIQRTAECVTHSMRQQYYTNKGGINQI